MARARGEDIEGLSESELEELKRRMEAGIERVKNAIVEAQEQARMQVLPRTSCNVTRFCLIALLLTLPLLIAGGDGSPPG